MRFEGKDVLEPGPKHTEMNLEFLIFFFSWAVSGSLSGSALYS